MRFPSLALLVAMVVFGWIKRTSNRSIGHIQTQHYQATRQRYASGGFVGDPGSRSGDLPRLIGHGSRCTPNGDIRVSDAGVQELSWLRQRMWRQ